MSPPSCFHGPCLSPPYRPLESSDSQRSGSPPASSSCGPDCADLRHIKREGAKIGTDRRLKLLEQIGNAVKDMHTHNPPLAHNDLKPDNILITPSGEARISDMGLSVKVDKDLEIFSMATFKEKGREINLTGRAPEVQEGLKDLTLAVDVWQLAVVFYHVLTGRGSPFLPEEAEEVAGKGKGEMSRIDTKKREQLLVGRSKVVDHFAPLPALTSPPPPPPPSPLQLNQQDRAIQEGAFDLRALEGSGLLDEQTALEARTLLSAMLSRNPSDRPTGGDIGP